MQSGISLIEMLLTVVVLGVLATISTMAVSHVGKNTQHRKLESDVKTLNSAIKIYVSNGGSLGTTTDPNAVLAKLKSTRSKTDKTLHVGAPSGRMIDSRVAADRIQLQLSAADSFGISSKSEFHVYEGATGQGELLGTFLPY